MTTIYPGFSSSHSSYFDDLDPYFFDDQYPTKEKEKRLPHKKWDLNDAIPDEEFEKAERFAKASPYIKKKVDPDIVETVTIQIFNHLYEIANRKRNEVEEWDAILLGHSPSPKKHSYSKSSRLFQSESNFSDDSYLDYPIQTENSIQNLLNAISEIFFGMRFDDEKAHKTPIEMVMMAKKDQVTWKNLSTNYSDYFQIKMEKIFETATELLRERIKEDEEAFYYRMVFYAGLAVAAVGMGISRKLMVINGLAVSLLMSSYMIVRYATASLRRMQQEDNLKLSVDSIYSEAASHRLNLSLPLDEV